MERRKEKKHRQTYPGPNSADNQQMLQDIRETLQLNPGTSTTGTPTGSERSAPERADSKEREHRGESERVRRQSPPGEVSGAASPRMQNRGSSHTPTKHISSAQSSHRAHQNTVRKQNLEKIRRDLQPFKGRERLSDPGFHHPSKDTVDRKMLEELINTYGYSEVGKRAGWAAKP